MNLSDLLSWENVSVSDEFTPLVDMATFCSADSRRDREALNDVTRHTSTPHPSGPNYLDEVSLSFFFRFLNKAALKQS